MSWLSGQLTVQHLFSPRLELLVNLYGHTASRDWNRQDFARNTNFDPPPANTARTVGDTGVDGGAIYMLESFGSRDRDFDVVGLEPRLIGQHCLFRREAEFHLGARIHYEHFVDERNNRDTYAGPVYTRNREDDHIYALAVFGQERVQVTRRLGLSAGLRLEAYRQMRHITRGNNMPVDIEGDSLNLEWIPGAGFTYDLGPNTVYGGVHRGFAPPRLSESIDSNGEDAALDAELSWNYELGVRGEPRPWLYYDVTGFLLDFENQIVPDNESGGASTENTNAGESIHYGFELSMQADLIHAFSRACDKPRCQPSLWLDVAYTYVMTENTTSGGLFEGNELPYAPNHILRAGMTFEDPRSNLTAGFVGTWTSEQYADQANTVVESNDGLVGEVPAYWVLDASVEWRVPRSRFTLRAAMNNILDERYVASRAPAGIHVGAPRHAFLGVRIDL